MWFFPLLFSAGITVHFTHRVYSAKRRSCFFRDDQVKKGDFGPLQAIAMCAHYLDETPAAMCSG
jgi:hypothetical protein